MFNLRILPPLWKGFLVVSPSVGQSVGWSYLPVPNGSHQHVREFFRGMCEIHFHILTRPGMECPVWRSIGETLYFSFT